MLLVSLFSLWMCAPLAPLNPFEQDTANLVNLQLSLGVHSPSEVLRAAPDLALRYEMLVIHPVIVRIGAEYKDGALSGPFQPRGPLQTYTASFDALYYRGTKELTGFFGVGPLYTFNSFTPNQATRDSLTNLTEVDDLTLDGTFGYRVIIGMRYHRSYSLEVRFTETYPNLKETTFGEARTFAVGRERIKTSSISVSFGYLFKLW